MAHLGDKLMKKGYASSQQPKLVEQGLYFDCDEYLAENDMYNEDGLNLFQYQITC